MPKEDFQKEVEKELTGRETEPWGLIFFKLYQSQMPVIERALETAALMLGSDRSRGYCLEMVCADYSLGMIHVATSTEPNQVLFAIVARMTRPCWLAYSTIGTDSSGIADRPTPFLATFLAGSFHLLLKSA